MTTKLSAVYKVACNYKITCNYKVVCYKVAFIGFTRKTVHKYQSLVKSLSARIREMQYRITIEILHHKWGRAFENRGRVFENQASCFQKIDL